MAVANREIVYNAQQSDELRDFIKIVWQSALYFVGLLEKRWNIQRRCKHCGNDL